MAYPSPVGVTSKAFTGGTITIGFADLPAGTAIGDTVLVALFTDGPLTLQRSRRPLIFFDFF